MNTVIPSVIETFNSSSNTLPSAAIATATADITMKTETRLPHSARLPATNGCYCAATEREPKTKTNCIITVVVVGFLFVFISTRRIYELWFSDIFIKTHALLPIPNGGCTRMPRKPVISGACEKEKFQNTSRTYEA